MGFCFAFGLFCSFLRCAEKKVLEGRRFATFVWLVCGWSISSKLFSCFEMVFVLFCASLKRRIFIGRRFATLVGIRSFCASLKRMVLVRRHFALFAGFEDIILLFYYLCLFGTLSHGKFEFCCIVLDGWGC